MASVLAASAESKLRQVGFARLPQAIGRALSPAPLFRRPLAAAATGACPCLGGYEAAHGAIPLPAAFLL
jgi:hypothetical protein